MSRLQTGRDRQPAKPRAERSRRGTWVLIGFLAIAAFFVLAEHKAHLMGALPYLLILLCPLLHVFHHRGHGGHHDHGEQHDGDGHGGHGQREHSKHNDGRTP